MIKRISANTGLSWFWTQSGAQGYTLVWGPSRVRTQEHLSTVCLWLSGNPDSAFHTDVFQTRDPALLGVISTTFRMGHTAGIVFLSLSLLGPQAWGTLVGQGGWACPEEARGSWVMA